MPTAAVKSVSKTISESRRLLVVCGAGISTSGGVPDFKTLYQNDSHLGNALHVQRYRRRQNYKALTKFLLSFSASQPTVAHKFLRVLHEQDRLLRCYTMNIDGLEAAVLPRDRIRAVHGLRSDPSRCGRGRVAAATMEKLAAADKLDEYNRTNACHLRPGFVMYGERARHIEELEYELRRADLILCIGTRLQVDPIASLVRSFSNKVVCINNEPVNRLRTILGDCDSICGQLIRALGSR